MFIACILQRDMIPLCIDIPAFLLHSEIYFLDEIFLLETISKLQQESEIPHVINNTPSIWALTFRAKNNYGLFPYQHGCAVVFPLAFLLF